MSRKTKYKVYIKTSLYNICITKFIYTFRKLQKTISESTKPLGQILGYTSIGINWLFFGQGCWGTHKSTQWCLDPPTTPNKWLIGKTLVSWVWCLEFLPIFKAHLLFSGWHGRCRTEASGKKPRVYHSDWRRCQGGESVDIWESQSIPSWKNIYIYIYMFPILQWKKRVIPCSLIYLMFFLV